MMDEEKKDTAEGVSAPKVSQACETSDSHNAESAPEESSSVPTEETNASIVAGTAANGTAARETQAETKSEPQSETYAFRWDYHTQREEETKREKTVRVRAGVFYGLMVGAMFALLLIVLLMVLLIGEARSFGAGGLISNRTERVVYISGAEDASDQLAVEAAVAKALPYSVGISISNGTGRGVGSGFVYSSDGYIVTNHHVIDGMSSIVVRLYDGTRHTAEVVGSDPVSDLALLHIDVTGLTPATFADSDALLVGETVIAIGSPVGISYAHTVTRGIVSCQKRAIKAYDESGSLEHTLLMVQTDASVNPGNSGGPLINRNGEVIGVISNKTVFYEEGTTYYADGMGLAIPANAATAILEDLMNGRSPDRSGLIIEAARLGVRASTVTAEDGYAASGVLVTGFLSESFDACEKLRTDDIITAVDGVTVTSILDAVEIIEDFAPGATVTLTVMRAGAEITVEVILGSDALLSN